MRKFDERSPWSPLTLPLLAGAALVALGQARLSDPRFLEQLGDRAGRAGDHAQAEAYYRRAMEGDPEGASAPCALALELAATGRTLAAQRLLEENLKRHPRDAASNEALADLAVRSLGEMAYPAVQGYYETALASDPMRAGAALGLSKIYLARNRLEDARRVLDMPLKAHDDNAALHLRLAEVYTREGEYGRADLEYDRGTARDARNAQAFDAWGQMLLLKGDFPKAEQWLRRALELKPDEALFHAHLAQALRGEGNMTEYENELATALRKDIHAVPVYLEIASTFQKAHDEERAESYLRLGVRANPASIEARLALADLLTNAADPLRRNLVEAAQLRQECVNDSKEPDLGLLLGAAQGWERAGQLDRSLGLIQKALAWGEVHGLSPDDLEALRKMRQGLQLALVPPAEGPPTFRSVEGRVVRDAADEPWPDVRQPPLGSVLDKPLTRLDLPPGPGTLFDPALFTEEGPKAPYQAGYRP